jgi:hypothetical protein
MNRNSKNKPKVVREIGLNDIKDAKVRETFRKANEFLSKCLDIRL